MIQTAEYELSDGTNNTWTPSIDGEDTNEDVDLEDNAGIWQEVPLQFDDCSISFKKLDSNLEFGNREEVKELKKRVLQEYNTLSNKNKKDDTVLNATQVMNAVYTAELIF